MNGILEQPKRAVMQGQPQEQPQAETPAPDIAVDPKLQEQMDAITANGLRMIHSKKLTDSLLKSITGSQDPVEAIADQTVAVIDRIEASAKQNNMTPDYGVLAQSANVLMGEIIMIAETAGLPPLSDEDKYRAFSLAVSKYIDDAVKSGKITQEQLQQMAEQAKQTPEGQQIMQAAGSMGDEPGVQTTGGQQPQTPPSAAPPPPSQPATGQPPAGLLQGGA